MSDPAMEIENSPNKWAGKINELGERYETRRVMAPVARVGWTLSLLLFVLAILVLFVLMLVLLPLFIAIDRARGREAGAERVKELLLYPWRKVGEKISHKD